MCRTFDFVMWIAPTEEIHVLAIELEYIFAENDRELRLEPTSYDPFWRTTWSFIEYINDYKHICARHAAKVIWIGDYNVTCTKLKQFWAEYGLDTFRARSVEISLRAIYLQPKCIEYCQDQNFDNWWISYNYEQLAHYLCWIWATNMISSTSKSSCFGAWHSACLWQCMLSPHTASDEIRV